MPNPVGLSAEEFAKAKDAVTPLVEGANDAVTPLVEGANDTHLYRK